MLLDSREEGRPKLEEGLRVVLLSVDDGVDDEERFDRVGRLGEERSSEGTEGRGGGDEEGRELMKVAERRGEKF